MSFVTHNRMIKKENFRKALFHFETVLVFRVPILLLVKICRLLPEIFLRRGLKEDQSSGKSYLERTYYSFILLQHLHEILTMVFFNHIPKIQLRIACKIWISFIDVVKKNTSHLVLLYISILYSIWLLAIIHTCGFWHSHAFFTPISALSYGHFSTRTFCPLTELRYAVLCVTGSDAWSGECVFNKDGLNQLF